MADKLYAGKYKTKETKIGLQYDICEVIKLGCFRKNGVLVCTRTFVYTLSNLRNLCNDSDFSLYWMFVLKSNPIRKLIKLLFKRKGSL